MKPSLHFTLIAMAMCSLASAQTRPSTRPTDLFGGTPTINAHNRYQTVMALANLALKVAYDRPGDLSTAKRILSLAFQIDPTSPRARTAAREIDAGDTRLAEHDSDAAVDHWKKQIRAAAQEAAGSTIDPDRRLAAYLYAALSAAYPNDDSADAQQLQKLSQSGVNVSLQTLDDVPIPQQTTHRHLVEPVSPAGNPLPHRQPVSSLPPPTLKPMVEIRGLVVQEAVDGRFHGRATDIIANAVNTQTPGIRFVGTVGAEMKTSMDEAIRIVRTKHADVDAANIEISFDDKYSKKDGGSAGTAFTLLLLAAYGDFTPNPQAAITGDITIDGKIRIVGEVPAKVHGAAADGCKWVAIPADNVADMDEAVLLHGEGVLWETQVFSCRTLDDAMAVMSSAPDPKLTQAMQLFDQLKELYGKASLDALRQPRAAKMLDDILALAPNHVSAALLKKWTGGQRLTHLTLLTTLREALAAAAPLRISHRPIDYEQPGKIDAQTLADVHSQLLRIHAMGDPSAEPAFKCINSYCDDYLKWVDTVNTAFPNYNFTHKAVIATQGDWDLLQSTVRRILTDPDVIDKLLHHQ